MAGHPEISIPGVETSTGSLGHGLGIGVGMAIALKLKKIKSKVVVIMGDGEINEGSVWESALHAAKHNLDNLIVIIDYNKIQSYGLTNEVCDLEPLSMKWKSFGFEVKEFDGHDYKKISNSFKKRNFVIGKPHLFISHSIKGKGYFKAENNPNWHHKRFTDEEINEIEKFLKMRNQFLKSLYKIALKNRKILFVGSDLGANVLDDMKKNSNSIFYGGC